MNSIKWTLVITAFFGLSQAPLSRAEFRGSLLYGKTNDFWPTVDALTGPNKSFNGITSQLNSLYSNPQEGIAQVSLGFYNPVNPDTWEGISDFFIGLRGDWLSGGSVTDRIFPELEGYQVRTAATEIGISQRLKREARDGHEYFVHSTVGFGEQQLVHGPALDLLNKAPIQSSNVFYWGIDGGWGYRSTVGEGVWSNTQLKISPTFFSAEQNPTPANLKVNNNSVTLRWKLQNEWTTEIGKLFDTSAMSIGVQGITGQNPIPIHPIPRTWDSVHNLKVFPNIASLLGIGTVLEVYTGDRDFIFRANGGYFGGYFGAGASINWDIVSIFAATWGLEQTSGFHNQESRIKYLGAGVQYVF